jgi:hypothetical protein
MAESKGEAQTMSSFRCSQDPTVDGQGVNKVDHCRCNKVPTEEYLISTSEVGRRTGLGRGWVYAQLRRKEDRIPHLVAGKYRLFRWTEIVSWLEKQRSQSTR